MRYLTALLVLLVIASSTAAAFGQPDPAPDPEAAKATSEARAETAEAAPEPAAGTATAAEAVQPASAPEAAEKDPLGTLGQLVAAVRAGHWRLAASLALALLMVVLARVRDRIKWFRGDRGGAALVGLLALGGALVSALSSSAPLDWKLFLGAAGVMWTAVGGYTWVKRLLWPKKESVPA